MTLATNWVGHDDFTYSSGSGTFTAPIALSYGDMVVVFAQVREPIRLPARVAASLNGGDDGGSGEPITAPALITVPMDYTFIADQDFFMSGYVSVDTYVSMTAVLVNPNPLVTAPTSITISSEGIAPGWPSTGPPDPPIYVGAVVYNNFNRLYAYPTDVPYTAAGGHTTPPAGISDGGGVQNPTSLSTDPLEPMPLWGSWAAGYELWETEVPPDDPEITYLGPGGTSPEPGSGLPTSYLTESVWGTVPIRWPAVGDATAGYSFASVGEPDWVYHGPISLPPERTFYRGCVQYWAIGQDVDYDPWDPINPPDPTGEGGAGVHGKLHIPHKEYAKSLTGVPESNRLAQYTANWTTIEAWANSLRCSGVIPGVPPDGEGDPGSPEIVITPTDAGWKDTRLHIPHKTTFSARHIHENYLAFERWARLVCPYCHIPHKEWMATYQDPNQELVNLLTIERWARDIGKCCIEVEGEIPGGGA